MFPGYRVSGSFRRWASTSPQSAKIRKILKRQVPEVPKFVQSCVSASKCAHYNLPQAVSLLTGQGHYSRMLESGDFAHAILDETDVFVLKNGVVVAWNMEEDTVVKKLLPLLRLAELGSFQDVETEDMDYVEEETPQDVRSGMIGDVIYIHGFTAEQRLLDKVAFSSGLARHTKLSALEMSSEKLIKNVEVISKSMAEGTETGLDMKAVERLTGRLLQIRGVLNLYSDITETPDQFWSQPELESLYELVSRKLDVSERIEILNKKLDYVADMVSILRTHLSEKNSVRLEWMIIILITVEVVFEMRHLVL